MSLFNALGIAASVLTAQSTRMNTSASNMANADSVSSPGTEPYKSKQVVFESMPGGKVKVSAIVESTAPAKMVYDPAHPMADANGYVAHSNVNPVEEMINMMSASRSYQSNVEVLNTTKQMLLKTLEIGKS